LLIEDNPDHAMLIQTTLENSKYGPRISLIADGEQALNYVATDVAGRSGAPPPDLVLLDLKLPKVDGQEVLKAMRAAPGWRQVPVVILTTLTRPADIDECYANGANGYLSKVVAPDTFVSSVRDVVDYWLRLAIRREAGRQWAAEGRLTIAERRAPMPDEHASGVKQRSSLVVRTDE
jgi:two-component system response regulator